MNLQCRNSCVHEFVFKELKVKTRVYFRGSLRTIIGHDFSTSIYVASVEAHCLHSALRHRRERHTSIYHSCYGFSDFFFMVFGQPVGIRENREGEEISCVHSRLS